MHTPSFYTEKQPALCPNKDHKVKLPQQTHHRSTGHIQLFSAGPSVERKKPNYSTYAKKLHLNTHKRTPVNIQRDCTTAINCETPATLCLPLHQENDEEQEILQEPDETLLHQSSEPQSQAAVDPYNNDCILTAAADTHQNPALQA
ncbi:hypothetical protein cyc_02041 [Cyclospora cayetanensis]|uniref:Uncharacterized protein n=1 Tax=Cyclospora cayetanensis TaxID=88456 RepID=A0A1D3CZD3_9EIME|nr:hypothetical protein cyc_02041 [Cyclospora cayetanensis]